MCAHRLGDQPTGLVCDRTDPHATGHTYHSTSGVPDAPKEEM